jgi:aminopeptidase-like protein/aminoglycoside N3'-acetyltransferase
VENHNIESEMKLSSAKLTYTGADLVDGLRRTGIHSGDIVFCQVSHDRLGSAACGPSKEAQYDLLLSALQDAIGREGTILLPSFSLSFERNEDYDLQHTPSVQGIWSDSLGFLEYFRQLPGVVRSNDPNRSVVALGPMAEKLLAGLPNSSYGKGCVHDRLLKARGKLCGIGVGFSQAEFLHFIEEEMEVPFRYKRLFTGKICQNGKARKHGWITSVPIQAENALTDASRLQKIAQSEKQYRVANVADGEVFSVDCAGFYALSKCEIAQDPWITARGPACDPIELENERTNANLARIELSPDASMENLISALWKLPRDIVSDGYDSALEALSTQVPMTIHEYPTGTECWTWLVPEKWTCHEAWLETLDGRRVFSYADCPLHVVSYSLPIDREVSRQELFEHLHVHALLPDAVPFIFKYYERDWGLCCSQNLKNSLQDNKYRVVIRSEFSFGTLKVGEVVAPGRESKSFVLCAHLCHPAMVNDDLSGVVAGIKVMQELLKRQNLRYTYRFLILPETIGSVAYLSHHEDLIPNMIGGLFLEMLAVKNPHALQLSFSGDSRIDQCFRKALMDSDPEGWTGPFRTVVGNDERQFNAPGVRVPMLSLSRVTRSKTGGWPYYPEYHSSFDTPELASLDRLEESQKLVLKMIEALESDYVPVNRYHGEVFCSRYGLNIDAYANPEGNRALFDIIFQIDGTKSVAEIASASGVSVESAMGVVEELRRHGLVD